MSNDCHSINLSLEQIAHCAPAYRYSLDQQCLDPDFFRNQSNCPFAPSAMDGMLTITSNFSDIFFIDQRYYYRYPLFDPGTVDILPIYEDDDPIEVLYEPGKYYDRKSSYLLQGTWIDVGRILDTIRPRITPPVFQGNRGMMDLVGDKGCRTLNTKQDMARPHQDPRQQFFKSDNMGLVEFWHYNDLPMIFDVRSHHLSYDPFRAYDIGNRRIVLIGEYRPEDPNMPRDPSRPLNVCLIVETLEEARLYAEILYSYWDKWSREPSRIPKPKKMK